MSRKLNKKEYYALVKRIAEKHPEKNVYEIIELAQQILTQTT